MEENSKMILSLALTGFSVGAMGQQPIQTSTPLSKETPNILVIVCEDISPYLGCYGDKVAVSPYLDQFAGQAILHTDMYTCVGVSAPSRYSLITGRYSSADGANYMRANYFNKDFGVVPPAGVKCYTELLRKKGYYCTNNSKTDYQFSNPVSAWDEQGEKAHWKNAPAHVPFFSIFNLNVTHESFIWKNTNQPLAVSPDDVLLPPYYPDTKAVRHDHAVLYSNIKKMDQQFHKLLKELEDSGRAENTIVIFYSDNGGPLPRGKREVMDSGTRVPFMIRFPDGQKAGTKNTALNMFVDIPPTILSLAGINTPAYMHGRAMYGAYKSAAERKYVFGATDRFDEQIEKRGSIRSNRYLYIRNYMPQQSVYRPVDFRLDMPMMREMLQLYKEKKLDAAQSRWFETPAFEEELYDCLADPHQIHNLADENTSRKVLNRMRAAYRKEWINPFNSDWETKPEAYFVEKMWPKGEKPCCEQPRLRMKNDKVYIDNNLDTYSAIYRIKVKTSKEDMAAKKGMTEKKEKWSLYTEPISLEKGDCIVVKLERIGYMDSAPVEFSL